MVCQHRSLCETRVPEKGCTTSHQISGMTLAKRGSLGALTSLLKTLCVSCFSLLLLWHQAYAAILDDGSVVPWGNLMYGGDSSEVQSQLTDVLKIADNCGAFAAIRKDGTVVTWGDADSGGDSSKVQDLLVDVKEIAVTDFAFAAILGDGSVQTWGDQEYGGDCSAVQDELSEGVIGIASTESAFAALKEDGSVITWGDSDSGGDSAEVCWQLKNVQEIRANGAAFVNVRGQEHTFGGVGIFVRHDKSAFQIQQKVCADGQAIMLQLDHVVVIGAYVPPRSQESEVVLEMDNWVASTNSPTLLMGDFNTLPDFANRWSHIRGAGAPCAVRDEQGNLLPTRWDGSRCIDWLWCSHPPMIETLEFDDAKFADHKPLKFKVKFDQTRVLAFKPVKTRNLLPTTDISQNSWKEAMEMAWSDAECPPISSTDCEWEHFCRIAEQAHVRALVVCNTHPSRPKLTRVKGSDFQVEELEPKTFRLTQHATLRELKLRKLLGRVSEALEQLRRGRRAPQVVYRKIWQHQFVRDQNFQSLQAIADWTELELRTHVKNTQLENLQRWRAQMRSSVQEAGRWVKKTTSPPVTSVFEQAYKHGKASSSNQETLQAVQCFWQSIWTREKPDVQEAFDFWRGGVEPPAPLAWEPLSATELQEQAKRQHGKASGCDGWQGSEVSSWPSHAFVILAELVERWFARGEMPTVFRSVRQCLLQKPNSKTREPDQALAASSLRPLAFNLLFGD